jgi:putative hydrolase of HD superfamily
MTLPRVMYAARMSGKLKTELRHAWSQNGRQESVADHSFRLALLAMLVAPHLDRSVDGSRMVSMALVHDLVEAEFGDVPSFELLDDGDRRKQKKLGEAQAMEQMVAALGDPAGTKVAGLWHEFEEGVSYEARVVKVLDRLEAQIQHNESSLDTWLDIEKIMLFRLEPVARFDTFLDGMRRAVEEDGIAKLAAAGCDVESYRRRAAEMEAHS